MGKVVPVLGAAGFSSDLVVKVDQVMSNFYICQPSQSDFFRDNIASLGGIIAMHGNSEIACVREIREKFGPYLSRQFDEVIQLDINSSTTTDGGIEIQITAIVRDGNKSIDIAHVVSSKDSKIRSIIDLQNDGRPIKFADQILTS